MLLRESLQRRICRTGFCLLCVLPTAGVLGYCASRKLPSHTPKCERELSERFGLRARLVAVSYPQPGLTRYEGLQLADAETDETALRCTWLEVERVDGRLVVSVGQPEIETDRLDLVWELLLRRLRRELAGESRLRLTPCQLTLRSRDGSQTYDDVCGEIEPTDQGEAIEIHFRVAGTDDAEVASLHIVRDRSKSVPATRMELDTGGGALPVSIFAPLADVAAWLGGGARFAGALWVDEAADGWNAEVTGHLLGVDLQTLIGDHFPHQLDGGADLEIGKALVRRGRLIAANGTFRAGPGTIGTSLVAAAVESLDCRAGKIDRDLNAVAFEELAFHFRIGAGGLMLSGACKSVETRPTVLVGTAGRVLLGPPPEGSVPPVIGLVRMLVPQSEVQVPATRETIALIGFLPIPPIVPANGAEGRPRAGRLRLTPSTD